MEEHEKGRKEKGCRELLEKRRGTSVPLYLYEGRGVIHSFKFNPGAKATPPSHMPRHEVGAKFLLSWADSVLMLLSSMV